MYYLRTNKSKEIDKMDIYDLEIITAITINYQNDIEVYLLEKHEEILQEDFGRMVGEIYQAYIDDVSRNSMLDDVNKKIISLDELY